MDVHLYASRENRRISCQEFSVRYICSLITLSHQIEFPIVKNRDLKKMKWFLPSQKRLNEFISKGQLKVLQKMRTMRCLSQDKRDGLEFFCSVGSLFREVVIGNY